MNKCLFCKRCIQNNVGNYMCIEARINVGTITANNDSCKYFVRLID